jgi:hypothetical protein
MFENPEFSLFVFQLDDVQCPLVHVVLVQCPLIHETEFDEDVCDSRLLEEEEVHD